jgi:hypothetical protein
MKFSKVLFWAAGGWGVLVLTPLYFIFDRIGIADPPPITHPGFYYGFVGAALSWQLAFFVIATDPVRYRPMMIPSVLEKFTYGIAVIVLFLQKRIAAGDLFFSGIDLLWGVLFVLAFFKVPARR